MNDHGNRARWRLLGWTSILILLLAGGWWGELFLRSDTGYRLFTRQETRIDLASTVSTEALDPGGRILLGGQRTVFFAPVSLRADTSYLISMRVGRGAGFSLGGNDAPSTQKFVLYYGSRRRTESLHQMIRFDADATQLRLRIRSGAERSAGELLHLSIAEYSSWHPRLLRAAEARSLFNLTLITLFLLLQGNALARALQRPARSDDVAIALLVGALLCVVFVRAPVNQISDSRYLTVTSFALLHDQRAALPDSFQTPRSVDDDYRLQRIDGRTYHFFPAAPALLNLPLVAAFEAADIVPVRADGQFLRWQEIGILTYAAALVAAGICSILYLLARLYLPAWQSLGLVAVFAFGTQIYSTISRPFWSHGWASLLLAAGLYLVLRPGHRGRITMLSAATLFSWAFFCRPTMSLGILAATALLLRRQRRHSLLFLATGAAWAVAFAARSLSLFGTWLPPYFSQSNFDGSYETIRLASSYPTALLGNLVSPSRGLFVFVPMFACVLIVLARRWKWIEDKDLALAGLLVILGNWQMLSLFWNWTGGSSFGPRLFSDIVVWFFLLAASALAAGHSTERSRRSSWRAVGVATVTVCVAFSIWVNARGANDKRTWNWNSRPFVRQPRWALEGRDPVLFPTKTWNWRYPQFLAGLLPPDPPDDSHQTTSPSRHTEEEPELDD